ncbi:glycine betaine ABC transporter substrate-binding protein [Lentibacillus sp. N15]|uniref:glycine betaine ABC transporter substrate-binding protein n=1 Tax=Lentibacillus songyuanensis TaxID=3136161 RepID=UPI0031BB9C5C
MVIIMLKKFYLIGFIGVIVMFSILLSACGNSTDNNSKKNKNGTTKTELGQEKLTMPYVSWASTVAGVNVMKAVLEDTGYKIDLKQVSPGVVFASLADGSADISVGTVTLPTTHADYWNKYKDQLEDLSVSMKKEVTIGLVVPSYVNIDSIEDLKKNTNNIGDKLDWTITGIDPGAGQMEITENEVMPKYGLNKWDLQSSSDSAMTAALKKAIDAHEPIVVTLWEPHWAFLKWDLKYLDDPDNLFGDPDSLHAVSRQGLEKDAPAANRILKQFHWTAKDMGEVMVMINDGMDPYEAGKKWVKDNPDKVSEWTKGVK